MSASLLRLASTMRSARVSVSAYAKVNLSLDVGPQRADGYHSIASVMQTVDLADTIEVRRSRTTAVKLTCDTSSIPEVQGGIPTDARNTAIRAATLILGRLHASPGVAIHIVKRIPAQAGLGGGSSDAAAVLRAVAALMGWEPDPSEMTAMASEIGSDVPFFLTGGTALVEGTGDKVTPVPPCPPMSLVIARPACGMATREAYRALDANAASRRRDTPAVLAALHRQDRLALLDAMGNHFETTIPELVPEIGDLMSRMRELGAAPVRLCGSGSAVFGVTDSEERARAIVAELSQDYPFAAAANTVESRVALGLQVLDDE